MAKVTIRSESCKSCGYCIKFCPKGVLAVGDKVNSKGYEYVVPVNEDACIACCMCARMCPDAAIEIYTLTREARPCEALTSRVPEGA